MARSTRSPTGVGLPGDGGPALSAQISDNFDSRDTGNLYSRKLPASAIARSKDQHSVRGSCSHVYCGRRHQCRSFCLRYSRRHRHDIRANLSRGVTGFLSAPVIPVPTTPGERPSVVVLFSAPIINVVNSNGAEQVSIRFL
jgi:hypothetical protein